MAKYLKSTPVKYLPFKPPGPLSERKQIYLPDFTITLIRTPFLPPRFASFWVPLNFNKLDMKDYLKRVYNVDVIKVRSYVEQQKVTRELPRGRQGHGPLRRPMSRKKMTVEMTEPFVWPEEPTDMSPWEKDTFFEVQKAQEEYSEAHAPDAAMKVPEHKRKSLAEQAQRILEGKEEWKPTWKALGLNYERPMARPLPDPLAPKNESSTPSQ
ncbi:hypothetical protein VTO42DRAFT_8967 [Malbranchea cinnamomea]